MARLTRKNIKVFAENATNNGVFGSLQAGNPVTTTNVEQVQSLPAWSTGWDSATMTSEKLPPLEEFQGVQYVTTYQQAYLMQEGIPEWASTVTYYKGCLAKEVTANGFRIYNSLTDNNSNHSLSDTSNWKKVMDSEDLYAFDNNVVHLTGDETIGGIKSFTDNLIRQVNSLDFSGFRVQNTQVTKGTTPSQAVGGQYVFQDSSGITLSSRLGGIETSYDRNGVITTRILACQPVANSTTYASISVIYPSSGNPYTACPTPTLNSSDDGYSGQIATVGWINGSNSNLVHKSGNETIGGTKTFSYDPYITNAAPRLYLNDTSQTKGTAPSASDWSAVNFNDVNGNTMGRCRQRYDADKSNRVELQVYKANSSSDTDFAYLGVEYMENGNPNTYAPASDVINSIVTTVNKSKGTNGYFKLGNGLIIQWGRKSYVSPDPQSVTFPTPFTSTNYKVVGSYYYNDNVTSGQDQISIASQTTTGFTFYMTNSTGRSVNWIAIGY